MSLFHLFHDWGKWQEVTMRYKGHTWAGVYYEGTQDCLKRYCKTCGMKQVRRV